jgi:hypothetical protein
MHVCSPGYRGDFVGAYVSSNTDHSFHMCIIQCIQIALYVTPFLQITDASLYMSIISV